MLLYNIMDNNKSYIELTTIRKSKSNKTLKKSKKGVKRALIAQLVVTLAAGGELALIMFLVPMIVSDSTSDGMRIFILTIVLAVVNEFSQLMVRVYQRFTDRVVISVQMSAFGLEFFIQFIRRILLGCMESQISVFIGLSLLSYEEGVMR